LLGVYSRTVAGDGFIMMTVHLANCPQPFDAVTPVASSIYPVDPPR
jgi:hypothetical protein